MEKRFHFTVGAVPRMGNARSVENFLADRLQKLDAYEVASPASCCRLTLAWIGGIPAGTRPEEMIEGAGMVRVMMSLIVSGARTDDEGP